MPRRRRADAPGDWHHVTNRAIARRAAFEGRADVRAFLAAVAASVRRGELEVHAFSILTTHYHLLVRSPVAALSTAMRRIQNVYVRRYNRLRRRDGPLFRGRFLSKPVRSLRYRAVLVRYIDRNPVAAGLCRDARDYPFGSAFRFARRRPRWLSREWVGQLYGPEGYPAVTDDGSFEQLDELVRARLRSDDGVDALDDLVGGAPAVVRERLRHKARLADGPAWLPCAAASALVQAAGRASVGVPWQLRFGPRRVSGWNVLLAGLLRDFAAQPFAAIADVLGISEMHAQRLCQRHGRLLLDDDDYANRAARIMTDAL
ncbi:MAG: transposase [Planctomycetes bacterium]|nr:transposase [Planctomycetota bacterium]